MKTTLTLIAIGLFLQTIGQQQTAIFLDAASASGVQQMFYKTSIARNTSNDVFTCGATLDNNGNYDILLTKHNSANVLQWSVTFAGSYGGDDYAADIALDALGNIYVVGTTQVGSIDYNAVMLKFNPSGTQSWAQTYAGSGNGPDGFTTVLVENNNSIYAAGGAYISLSNLTDALSVKYDSTGTSLWTNTWNNSTSSMQDAAVRIVNSGGQTYVFSASQSGNNPVTWKMAQPRYNSTTGAFIAAGISSGDDTAFSTVSDVAVDGVNHILVAGTVQSTTQGKNIRVARFNLTLTEQWVYNYNGAGNTDDEAMALALVGTSHVYVTGYTTSTANGKDLFAAKLVTTSGAVVWDHEMDLATGDDRGAAISLDVAGNAFIATTSYKDGNDDMVVSVLSSSAGTVLATNRYNSTYNRNDQAQKIALDVSTNEVYMAGQIETAPNTYSYMLTKWSVRTVYAPVPVGGYSSSGGYIENRGQLRNEDGTSNTSVKFYCQKNSPCTYLDDSKISYVFSSPKADTLLSDTLHRVDMTFKRGVENAKIYPISERPEYANFYLGHMLSPSERTAIFNAVVKIGTYTNTDVIYTNNNSGYRHWIVARSGAPTGDFIMEYTGQSSLSINGNGDLVIATSVGNQIQPKANVYTMNNTTGVMTLLSWQPGYVLNGNAVSFSFPNSWTGTLVIEMQRAANGGGDLIDNVELEWSTYFGDLNNDRLNDVFGNENGSTWVTGATVSNNFPLIPGSYILYENAGAHDIITASFGPNCAAIWLSYYGGSGDDWANAITRSASGYLIVVGYTESIDLPDIAEGALDDDIIGGFVDGVIIKMKPEGIIVIDSYLGGEGSDQILDCDFNHSIYGSDIYLVGNTDSDEQSFPVVNPAGAYSQLYAGAIPGGGLQAGDGFIVRINEINNNILWSTFFGSNSADMCLEIAFAASDVFIMGVTTSNHHSSDECSVPNDGNFPFCAQNGSWSNNDFEPEDLSKLFISRFDRNNNALKWSTFLCLQWSNGSSTYFDTRLGLAAAEPEANDLYVCGYRWAPVWYDFPFITSPNAGSYNQTEDADNSLFLFRFNVTSNSNQAEWSTAIDGVGNQWGSSVCVTEEGTVYVTGSGIVAEIQNSADWCEVPDANDNGFPMCNASGNSYMETEVDGGGSRSVLCAFDSDDKMIWSTQFGNHHANQAYNSYCAGDYVYICGEADFPISGLP
jgi:hypothetical protein